MKSIIVKILLYAIPLIFTLQTVAQQLVNKGTTIVIKDNTYLSLTGGTDANYINKSGAPNNGAIDLDGLIVIEGDWINDAVSGNVLTNVDNNGEVIFRNDVLQKIDGSCPDHFVFEKLTIGKNSQVELMPGKNMTLYGDMDVQVMGELTLRSDNSGTSSFIDNGTITNIGNINVERYFTGNAWHFISPPISDALSELFLDMYLQEFDETELPANAWKDIIPVGITLNAMQGYSVWSMENPNIVTYTGDLNTGNKSRSLSHSGSGNGDGWNLVGNSYPSVIDWDAPTGWTKPVGMNNSLYIWDQTINYPSGNYRYYVGAGGSNLGGVGAMGGTQYIAPGQAFFVNTQTDGVLLAMDNNVRVHDNVTFYKNTETNDKNILRLTVEGDNMLDETVIRFYEEASNGFDNMFDAHKLFVENIPQIYSVIPDQKIAINTLPEINSDLTIPLGFQPGNNGMFQISIAGSNSFEQSVTVFLEDIKSNEIIELNENFPYNFNASTNDGPDRFILHFSVPGEDLGNKQDIKIYACNNYIYIKNLSSDVINEIHVYNLMGQETLKIRPTNDFIQKININTFSGYYIVEVRSTAQVITQKVFLGL